MALEFMFQILLIVHLVSCNNDTQDLIITQAKALQAPSNWNRYGYNQQYSTPYEDDDSKNVDKEPLIEIAPVNAFVAGLVKLFTAFLIGIGTQVTIVGKRETDEEEIGRNQHSDNWQYALISEALLMGSMGDSIGCLQRASCEAPTAAKIISTSFEAMHLLAQIHLLPVDTNGNYDATSQVLRNSSAMGIISHELCHKIYPCRFWSKLKTAALISSNEP